jgi:hypothetical protein
MWMYRIGNAGRKVFIDGDVALKRSTSPISVQANKTEWEITQSDTTGAIAKVLSHNKDFSEITMELGEWIEDNDWLRITGFTGEGFRAKV